MSTVTLDWPRWVHASIHQHFKTRCENYGTMTFPMFIEGQHRGLSAAKDFFELRVDGPQLIELSKNYWLIYVEVNVLIQSVLDDSNNHRMLKDCGVVAAAFDTIQIYKYGNGVNDKPTELFGCLGLRHDRSSRESTYIYNLGQVESNTKLLQSVVEGHFQMHKETA